jgi:hypothetical protein
MDIFLEKNLRSILPNYPPQFPFGSSSPERTFERFWPFLEELLDHLFNRDVAGVFERAHHAICVLTNDGAWELLFEEFKSYVTGKVRRWAIILKKTWKMEGKVEFGRAFLELSRFYKQLISYLKDCFMYAIRYDINNILPTVLSTYHYKMSENAFEAQLIFTFKQEILNEFGLDDFLLRTEASCGGDDFSDMFIAFKSFAF